MSELKRVELLKNHPLVASILRATPFGGGRGRKPIVVQARETVRISDYWSEGSRDEVRCVSLESIAPKGVTFDFVRQETANPFGLAIGEAKTRPGRCYVERSIFRGKPMAPRIYVHPEDFARFTCGHQDCIESLALAESCRGVTS